MRFWDGEFDGYGVIKDGGSNILLLGCPCDREFLLNFFLVLLHGPGISY